MSTKGQGDAIGETSKDDEAEISSTIHDGGGMAQNVSNPPTIDVLPSDTQSSKPNNSEEVDGTTLASIEPSRAVAQVDTAIKEGGLESERLALNDTCELRSDDDDENAPPVSDEVLKLVDQEIEEEQEAIKQAQTKQIDDSGKHIDIDELEKDLDIVKSSQEVAKKENNVTDDVEMLTLDESLEQSKRMKDTDSLTEDKVQDLEMKDIQKIVDQNELVTPIDVKIDNEQSFDKDTLEVKKSIDNVDTLTCDNDVEMDVAVDNKSKDDDIALINTVSEESNADILILATHIEPNMVEMNKKSTENSEELIASSLTDSHSVKDIISTSSNCTELPVDEISETTIENSMAKVIDVEPTSSDLDNTVLPVQIEVTSENVIESSGPTKEDITEPLKVDDTKTMILSDLPINIPLEPVNEERKDIDENMLQLSDEASMLDTTINPNVHHRLNKPNAMLDIPTQEFSDIEAELEDDDSYNEGLEKSQESMKMEISIEQSSENVIKYNSIKVDLALGGIEGVKLDAEIITISDDSDKLSATEVTKKETEKQTNVSTNSAEENVISDSDQITDDVELSTKKPIKDASVQLEADISTIISSQDEEPSTSTPKKIIHEEKLTNKVENDESLHKSNNTDIESKSDEIGNEFPLISKFKLDNEPSTSKSDQVLQTSTLVKEENDIVPTKSTEEPTSTQDNKQPSISKTTEDDQQPSTSKSTKGNQQLSTSKSTQDEAQQSRSKSTEDDQQPSTSKSTEDDQQPSTSKSTQVDAQASTSKSTEDDQQPSTSKSTQDDQQPSTSKSTEDDQQPSASKSSQDDQQPSTSKSTQDDQQPSTSKATQDDQQPSTSKSTQDDQQPSTSKATQDDQQPSTSKSTEDDQQPSASKSSQDDQQPSTSKSTEDDQQPSTSKSIIHPLSAKVTEIETPSQDIDKQPSELTSDIAEVQELTDSLGLLAESSRVMDDDEEPDDEEPEPENEDENDDDDDFDPYEETSSQMVVDQEETASSSGDGKVDPSPSRPESDEGTMDVVDDIECVENELPVLETEDSNELVVQDTDKDEPEIIDADAHKELPQNVATENVISILKTVLQKHSHKDGTETKAPVKVINFVEIGDASSDSDDVLEVSKGDATEVTVNIPRGVEVMATCAGDSTTEITSREGEVVIRGVPKPAAPKPPKINTSEVTVSTAKTSASINIPETIIPTSNKDEVFNIDSDEEEPPKDPPAQTEDKTEDEATQKKPVKTKGCANPLCSNPLSDAASAVLYPMDRETAGYYSLKRRGVVCADCMGRAHSRGQRLLDGIKDLRPLLDLDMEAPSQQLVTISDSESDEEAPDDSDVLGDDQARFLEEHLADMINETWARYKMDSRLKSTETVIMSELDKLEASAREIDDILNECQKKTDASRLEFYGTFQPRRKHLGGLIICDTPFNCYSHMEKEREEGIQTTSRYPKRRAAATAEPPAKKSAIPMGYTAVEPQEAQSELSLDPNKGDDDKDISVVRLSAEAAPSDLPPCGEAVRPPLRAGASVYAMRNAYGAWLRGRLVEVLPRAAGFTQCNVKFEHKTKNSCKVLPARCLAYMEPSEVRMTIGTRVIALFKDPHNEARGQSFYSGVVAEIPNPVNSYRYLVFFDDGYAQYVHHRDTRLVCESSVRVWEEVHPFIREFICKYLRSYPERPMVRLHTGERLKTEWNGKWWDSKVLQVDASIALIHFNEDNRTEWIYRGSTRLAPLYLELQAAAAAGGRPRARLPRSKAQIRSNMPCVEYTRSDEPTSTKMDTQTQNEELRRQRAVAKKSTTQAPTALQGQQTEGVLSRVVYYTPKIAIMPLKLAEHSCSPSCRRTDVLSLKELRTYNPLAKPLLSGWERQTVRYKGHKEVMYRSPCGRRLRNISELHRYLRVTDSELGVDLFDFTPGTHCLAEFVLNKCLVGKKDLSHGKENVPVPCVNYYDESLPEFCSYNTERTPTAGVPLNLDPSFLCGCDCTDDCEDKSKCACWQMTLEGARTIGLDSPNVGYVYRRLPEPLPSGIYECNSRCKCKQTCLNRVAQHPLQLKLQVFKTINRGWGIRALNDVPKGSFLCVYAGNLLTDATANLDGLNEGDEYLAELDYIEVVEAMKEGYEEDIPDGDKKLDKMAQDSESSSAGEQTSEEEGGPAGQSGDEDFQPGYVGHMHYPFKKSLRKRSKKNQEDAEQQKEEVKKRDECITISDDEEVREPSRFTAQADMLDKSFKSKNSSRVSVRTLYGKDEACYIMDAKVQGNIGRYLNHSCHPNVFVQNVFVDTHDPRFPWVAFFALSHVKAGTELTWNYNYDVGSVPGKVLYCYCGAANCRGRLL